MPGVGTFLCVPDQGGPSGLRNDTAVGWCSFCLCFCFLHLFSVYKSKLWCGLVEQLFNSIKWKVTWFYNHIQCPLRSLGLPASVSRQRLCVWEAEFETSKGMISDAVPGRAISTQAVVGPEILGTDSSLVLAVHVSSRGLRKVLQIEWQVWALRSKSTGTDGPTGWELLKTKLVRPATGLMTIACTAFPETFPGSGLFPLLTFCLVL